MGSLLFSAVLSFTDSLLLPFPFMLFPLYFLFLGHQSALLLGSGPFLFWNFKRRKVVALGAHFLLRTFLFRFLFSRRQLFWVLVLGCAFVLYR